jgi:O-antigen/teichoic acid export membrane protein
MAADEADLSTLLTSATLVMVGQVLYSVSKLVERLVIGRVLSPEAYGDVSIALALMMVASTIGLLGLRQGVPRYISRFDDQRAIRGAWVTGLVVAGLAGIVVAAALTLGADSLTALLLEAPEAGPLIALFALAVPFVIGMEVGVGAVRGLENTIYRTYARDLLYPGVRLATLIVFLVGGAGILAAGYAYLIGAIAAFLAVHVLLNRLLPLLGGIETDVTEMMAFSLPLVISTLLSRLLTRTDTIMLGFFRPSFEVGLYSAAFPLASALVLVLSSFGFMYLPVASRLDAEDKRDEVDSIYKITTKWIFVLTFPAFLTLVVFSGDVLAATFGTQYVPAGTALSILAVGFFSRAAFGRSRETVSALGFTTYLLVTNVFAFILNVGLNLVLIPRYGPNGAAIASAVSFVGLNLAVYAFLAYRFDISPFSTTTRRSVLVLPLGLFPPALLLASQLSLGILALFLFVVVAELVAIVLVAVTGCLEPADEILVGFVEDTTGFRIPLIRRFIPDSD